MKGVYDVADPMRTALTVDRIRLEDEIEDLEFDISVLNLILAMLELPDHNGNTIRFLLMDHVDDASNVERKRDVLRERLKTKRKDLEYVMQRLEDYE